MKTILINIMAFILFVALSASSALATPEEDAAREVAHANRPGDIDRDAILRILLDHPTESVVLEAMKWPWELYPHYKLAAFLATWVLRSPKVRDFFRKTLFEKTSLIYFSPLKNILIKILAPTLGEDTLLHAEARKLATEGYGNAIQALAPFIDQSIEDQRAILEGIYKGMDRTGGAYFSAMKQGIAILSRAAKPLPEFAKLIVSAFTTPASLATLDAIISVADPQIFERPEFPNLKQHLARAAGRDIDSYDGRAFTEKAIKLLLKIDPNGENLHRLAEFITHYPHLAYDQGDIFNSKIFAIAKEWIGKSPEVDRAIDKAFEVLMTRVKKGEHVNNYESLFKAYLSLHRNAKSFNLEQLREFLGYLPYSRNKLLKQIADHELIAHADSLPPAAQPFIEEAIAQIDIRELARGLIADKKIESVSSALIKLLREKCLGRPSQIDFHANIFETAIYLTAYLASYDDRCRDILRQAFNTGGEWQKGIIEHYINSLGQPNLEGWQLSYPLSEKARAQRSLWTDQAPSMGWRQVAQVYAFDPAADPFLFSASHEVFGTAEEVALMRRGSEARNHFLSEAERQLERTGIIVKPVEEARKKLESRKKAIAMRKKEEKLTASQRRQIETQAKMLLQASNPGITEDDLASSPYREKYQRLILELEWSGQNKPKKTENTEDETITEAWRQITLLEMQEGFRKSLNAIAKSGHGKVLAVAALMDGDHGHEIALHEKDLSELTLSTEGVYWHGKRYMLHFQPRSIDEARLEELPRHPDALEIAALTLGNKKGSPQDIAQEIYLGRVFDGWVSSYQTACALIKDKAASRMSDDLSEGAKKEAFALLSRLYSQSASPKALASRLWQPIEKDPDYWRKREIDALNEGRKEWKLFSAEESSSSSSDSEGPRAKSTAPSDATPLRHAFPARDKPWNKPLERDEAIFRIEAKMKNRLLLPRYFNEGFIDDFYLESDPLNKLADIGFEHAGSEFVVHSEKVVAVKSGLAPLPRPLGNSWRYDLSSIQVFSESGSRLYPGKDYEVMENKRTSTLAIKVLHPSIEGVRLSAGFKPGVKRNEPAPPSIDPQKLTEVIDQLEEAGFTKLSDKLRKLLRRSKKGKAIDLFKIAAIFKDEAVYAKGNEKDLGKTAPTLNGENPFEEFARFLNAEGRVCAQCDGTNGLFALFLSVTLGPDTPYQIETSGLLVRKEGSLTLNRIGHATTVIYSPDHLDPLGIDVTPSTITMPNWLQKIIRWFKDWKQRRIQKTGALKTPNALPPWLSQVKDQMPEISLEHAKTAARPMETEIEKTKREEETKKKIEEKQKALERQVRAEQKEGALPANLKLDPSEPLARAQNLAQTANRLIEGTLSLEAAREKLCQISPRFRDQPLETKARILAAIASFAAEDRARFERYMQTTGAKGREYYKNPHLRDQINLLYRSIEELSGPLSAIPSKTEIKERKTGLLQALEKESMAACGTP